MIRHRSEIIIGDVESSVKDLSRDRETYSAVSFACFFELLGDIALVDMALTTATLCGSLSLSASSSYSSLSTLQDVDLALAAQRPGGTGVSEGGRLVVLAAGRKKVKVGVEHHRDGESKPTLPPKFGLKWLENGGELTGLKMEELVRGGHGVLFGSRIPKHYFMVKGFGQTEQGDGSDPWETGSYDLALEDAGNFSHFSRVLLRLRCVAI